MEDNTDNESSICQKPTALAVVETSRVILHRTEWDGQSRIGMEMDKHREKEQRRSLGIYKQINTSITLGLL